MKTRHWIAFGLIIASGILWGMSVSISPALIVLAFIVEFVAASIYDENPPAKNEENSD